MKDILIQFSSPSLDNNIVFKTDDINHLNDAWKALKKELETAGYNIKTADQNSLENVEMVIFHDGDSLGEEENRRHLYKECIENGLKNKTVLFIWECKSVKPYNFSPELHNKFSRVLTWDDDLVDNEKFFKFYLPTPISNTILHKIDFKEKNFLVNISANKLSNFPNELYGTRRKSIKFFENKLGEKFDLFGPRWNKPVGRIERWFPFLMHNYKSFKGIAQNKIETLSKYKFSICYENAKGYNGYVTEKIFDCFCAGTVPIYLGAENITSYVDENTFIDRRKFNSDQKLLDYLYSIDESQYNNYIKAISLFLASDKIKPFLPESFANTIVKNLELKK